VGGGLGLGAHEARVQKDWKDGRMEEWKELKKGREI